MSEGDLRRIFSTLNTYQTTFLVAFCGTISGIEVSFWTDGTKRIELDGQTDGQTDVEVEIVI